MFNRVQHKASVTQVNGLVDSNRGSQSVTELRAYPVMHLPTHAASLKIRYVSPSSVAAPETLVFSTIPQLSFDQSFLV